MATALTEDQKRLIVENLSNIRTTLRCMIRKLRPHLRMDQLEHIAESALAHTVEAATTFSPDKGQNQKNNNNGNNNKRNEFHKYAAFICYARTIDEGRKHNKMPPHKQNKKNAAINRIDESVKKQGFADPDELAAANVNPLFISLDGSNVKTFGSTLSYHDTGPDAVDWEDTKASLVKRFDTIFGGKDSKKNILYRALLCDYLIPKVEGEQHPTLAELAARLDVSEGWLSQVMHSKQFTHLIAGVLK